MKKLYLLTATLLAAASLSGCFEKGPAEKVGKTVDESYQKAKDNLQNKGSAQKIGESIDERVNQS